MFRNVLIPFAKSANSGRQNANSVSANKFFLNRNDTFSKSAIAVKVRDLNRNDTFAKSAFAVKRRHLNRNDTFANRKGDGGTAVTSTQLLQYLVISR